MKKEFLSAILIILCSCTATVLPRDNWEESTYEKLTELLKEASSLESPYAVFDFDNTTIINDLEYSLMAYQIQNLRYKMKPCEFKEVITACIPDCTVPIINGLTADMLVQDLEEDYAFLYENHISTGTLSLEDIRKTDQYLDFRAKMFTLCYGVEETFPLEPAYLWLIQPLYGFTYPEISEFLKESCSYWLTFPEINEVTWTSPDRGVCGICSATHMEGMRLTKEMKNLYATLKKSGIDVYICSAAMETIVEAYACDPKFGLGLNPDHVFGLRFPHMGNGFIDVRMDTTQFQPFLKGKTDVIKNEIAPQHGGRGPVLVGGDSNGDYYMLTDFPDLRVGLIIWCGSTGGIKELAKSGLPKYTVQHRSLTPPGFVREAKEIL